MSRMTWHINATGTRASVTNTLQNSRAADGQSDETRDQHDTVRDLLLDEISKLPEGAAVACSAHGHVDNGHARTLYVSLSASVPRRVGGD